MSETKMLDDAELITATVLCMSAMDGDSSTCNACPLCDDDGCTYLLKNMIVKRILQTTNNVYIKM